MYSSFTCVERLQKAYLHFFRRIIFGVSKLQGEHLMPDDENIKNKNIKKDKHYDTTT